MANRGRKPKTNLTEAQEREIVEAYRDKTLSAKDLVEMNGLNDNRLYRLLRRYGVQPHQRQGNGLVKITKIDPKELELPPETEVPVIHTAPVEVVVDKENLVQTAIRHSSRRLRTWEVSYSGTVLVEADEIEEAIREARKLGVVKRIHSAVEKKE
jgi:hypothetical protein